MKCSRSTTRAGTAMLMTMAASITMAAPGARADDLTSVGSASRSFSTPTTIDNTWAPRLPGTRLVLEGTANPGTGVTSRRIVATVTDLTKVINGVRTLVSWDRDYTDNELSESELAFHAQDDAGTVWNMGEYPEEFDGGVFEGAPSTWLDGVAGARAGIEMQVRPRTSTPSYRQWHAPALPAVDRARVSATHQHVCVPVACYDNVVVIEEWDPQHPEDGRQLKYHAPGVGVVRVDAVGGEEQESLVLVRVACLSGRALDEAREEARRLDRRGYRVSPDVYGLSPPVEHVQPWSGGAL